jgi:hypothetical protein
VKTQNGASKTTCEIHDKKSTQKQFISSQAFYRTPGGRVREITAGEQFEPRILKSFDPVTQELYRLLPATIDTQQNNDQAFYNLTSTSLSSSLAQQNMNLSKYPVSRKFSQPVRTAPKQMVYYSELHASKIKSLKKPPKQQLTE